MNQNILTCDLEDWYHTTVVGAERSEWDLYEQRVVDTTKRILDFLSASNVKITFFVLGYVAEKYPDLIELLHKEGHEVASHTHTHPLIYDLDQTQFKNELKQSISVLTAITGTPVVGFRAPSWSINRDMEWAFETMLAHGIQYDSSLFPFKTFLYGDNAYPRFGYDLSLEQGDKLYEMPPSVGEILGKRVPFCGGFYLRVLPYKVIRKMLRSFEKENQPTVIYFHPWEIDTNQPRVKLKAAESLIQYYNIRTMERKLKRLINEFEFMPMGDYLRNIGAISAENVAQSSEMEN